MIEDKDGGRKVQTVESKREEWEKIPWRTGEDSDDDVEWLAWQEIGENAMEADTMLQTRSGRKTGDNNKERKEVEAEIKRVVEKEVHKKKRLMTDLTLQNQNTIYSTQKQHNEGATKRPTTTNPSRKTVLG